MSDALQPLIAKFENVARDAETLAFAPRDTGLQRAAVDDINAFLKALEDDKELRVQQGDEGAANAILSMELALEALRHQLQMWVALKGEAPEAAWDHLVDAQQACDSAIAVRRQLGVKPQLEGLENLLIALRLVEQVVFLPQVFCSFGGTVRSRECSICGGDYDTCGHVRGRAYMGKLCRTIVRKIDLEEVSFVPYPASKRAGITHFSDGDRMRNRMTWRLEEPGDRSE